MRASQNNQGSASLRTDVSGEGTLTLTLSGRLDSRTTGPVWREAARVLGQTPPPRVIVDASQVEYCDGSGIGFLLDLRRRQQGPGRALEIRGLAAEFQNLLDLYDPREFEKTEREERKSLNIAEDAGRAAVKIWQDFRTLIAFVGELLVATLSTVFHPRKVRWKDAFYVAEQAGVNALPIIGLMGFLIGLIIAFQSAIPLRQFGAEIFVANLVGLSMVRELGPLITAIILAGRTGSAFAAELGTMKVNEEIDALTTMGLDPVRFLVASRVMAATFVTPLLTIFCTLFALIGGGVVFVVLGFPVVTYISQLVGALNYVDLLGALFKAFVFGIVVAGIGCLRGLQTATGAQAVGESTTRAVVAGIALIIAIDGIFGVVYFYLGI